MKAAGASRTMGLSLPFLSATTTRLPSEAFQRRPSMKLRLPGDIGVGENSTGCSRMLEGADLDIDGLADRIVGFLAI